MRNTEPGPGYVHISKHHSPEVFEQITSERMITRYVKGHPRLEWVKPAGKRNEALDCAVYALAAAHFLGVERWRESDWQKVELQAQGRDLFDTPAVDKTADLTESETKPTPMIEPKPAATAPFVAPKRRTSAFVKGWK